MFRDDENKIRSVVGYSHYTSQIIALQEELKKSKDEHQSCVVALERLNFLNSHQIRHAVCQIISLSELLEKATRLNEVEPLSSFIKIAARSLDVFSRKMTKVFEQQGYINSMAVNNRQIGQP